MFPKLPADLGALTLEQLKALKAEYVSAAKALADTELSAEQQAEATQGLADFNTVKDAIAARAAAQAAFEATAAGIADMADEDETDDGAEADASTDDADKADKADKADEDGDTAQAGTTSTALAIAPVRVPKRPAALANAGGTQAAAQDRRPVGQVDVITSARHYGDLKAGDSFESWAGLSSALIDMASSIDPGTKERFVVGKINARYDASRTFSEDPMDNMRLLNAAQEEITAALCAPATPYYNLGCMNTARRPVFNSMPTFAAPRGAVSIYPSPTLEDIDAGTGIWTHLDDANPSAVKNACQTIDCADSETYRMYGSYRCITIKNMLAMTFPELVEAYLNRLAAAQARMAEKQLLNTMGARADAVDAPPLDFDGPVSLATALLTLLALHQETQRWDEFGPMNAWLPRWVKSAIKISLMRRRNTTGEGVRVVSDGEVNALFQNVGFNPIWFIDTPTWAPTIPPVHRAGSLQILPQEVPVLVAPAGKFAIMDRGSLSIGVTGNNIYRDNTSNSKNDFTMFWENFEGVVDTDSCPSYLLTVPACWNGVQIGDIAAPECDGTTIGS